MLRKINCKSRLAVESPYFQQTLLRVRRCNEINRDSQAVRLWRTTGLLEVGEWKCPRGYISADARQSFNALIRSIANIEIPILRQANWIRRPATGGHFRRLTPSLQRAASRAQAYHAAHGKVGGKEIAVGANRNARRFVKVTPVTEEERVKHLSFWREYLNLSAPAIHDKNSAARVDRNVPIVLPRRRRKIQQRMPLQIKLLDLRRIAIINNKYVSNAVARNRLRVLKLARLRSCLPPLHKQLEWRWRRILRRLRRTPTR